MRPEAARQRVEAFTKRFGEAHKYLAYHAAFPLALTPDLLYCLWANFQRDIKGTPLSIPWVAVADLLLSGLCDEVANETYEMDIAVRDELLGKLQAEPRFGQPRIEELSEFLFDYVRRQLYSDDPDVHDFAQAQQWTALAYTKPGEAAEEIAKTLAGLNQGNRDEHLRMVSVLETLKQPLSEFTPLLSYARGMGALSRGQVEKATSHFDQAAPQGGRQVQVARTTLTIPPMQSVAQSPSTTQKASSDSATVVADSTVPAIEATNSTSQTVAPSSTQNRMVFVLVSEYPGQIETVEFFLHTFNKEIVSQFGVNTPYSYIRSIPHNPEESWKKLQQEFLTASPFFIPLITPYFFEDFLCRQELEFFLEREKVLRRKLIYPVYCQETPPLQERAFGRDELVDAIITHQWTDIRWFNVEEELERKPLKELAEELAGNISATAKELQSVPPVESPRVINQEAQAREASTEQAGNIAETPERARPSIAFISYSIIYTLDKRLPVYINLLNNQLRKHTGEEAPLAWDQALPSSGAVAEEWLQQARENAAFLIPILTPNYFQSRACRSELTQFLDREKSSGRTGLIFPIYYIETPQLTDESLREKDTLAQAMSRRAWADWRELRFEPLNSSALHEAIAKLAGDISISWRELQDRRDVPRPAVSDSAEALRSKLKDIHEWSNEGLITEAGAENLRKELINQFIKDDQSIERDGGVTFEQKLKALESVPLFRVFTPDELRELAASMRSAHYAGDQPIVIQDQPDEEMYIIRNGRARVSINTAGKVTTIGILDEGADLGRRRLLLGEPTLATVSAQTEGVSCYVLSREPLRPILQRRPEIVDEMAKMLAIPNKTESIDITLPALIGSKDTPEETAGSHVVEGYAKLIKYIFQLDTVTSAPASKAVKKSNKVSGSGAASKKAAKAKPQTQVGEDRPQPTRRKQAKRRKERRDRPAFSLDAPPDQSSTMEDWREESLGMIEAAAKENSIYRLREAARFSRAGAGAAQAAASKKRPAKSGAAKKGSSKSAASKSGAAKSSALRPGRSESPLEPSASASVSKRASSSSKRGSAKGGSRWSAKGAAKRGSKSAKSSKDAQRIARKKK